MRFVNRTYRVRIYVRIMITDPRYSLLVRFFLIDSGQWARTLARNKLVRCSLNDYKIIDGGPVYG